MSGLKYLADTNAFICLLNGYSALQALMQDEWQYSLITEIELLYKPGITHTELKTIKSMLALYTKVVHEDAINQRTIALKQQYKIKLPDALIAPTALYKNVPLITFDKGFKCIGILNLIVLNV